MAAARSILMRVLGDEHHLAMFLTHPSADDVNLALSYASEVEGAGDVVAGAESNQGCGTCRRSLCSGKMDGIYLGEYPNNKT